MIRLIIRGNGSLNGNNQPMYAVNDLPIDNTQLNLPGIENGVGFTKIDGTLDAWMLVPILMVLLVQNKARMI